MIEYLNEVFDNLKSKLTYLNDAKIMFSVPKDETNGDYSTNLAMTLTKVLKRNPREIANEIIDNLEYDKSVIEKIEIAGPGFINFYFSKSQFTDIIKAIFAEGDNFGKSDKYKGKKANVEFVSANPTGPLTVGHGRNAVIGDTVANMLEFVGYDVDREYYFNNAGRQMRVLGQSVKYRCRELLGEEIEFPEDHYQGEYIKDVARHLIEKHGDDTLNQPDDVFKDAAEKEIFADIENTLGRLSIKMKNFYNENTLYSDGRIDALLKNYDEKGFTYKKDDALWLKLSEMGRDQDKVIIKSTGEPTYRLPDMAYHITKLERGYDLVVDLFGSDHMDAYPDVLAGLEAIGYDVEKIKVLIHQFVTITRNGEVVKMSTRKANFVTIDELIDEVGSDVVRYFFIMRSISTHLNFDLEIAKKQSDENPVFYLQYAHARICSMLRMTESEGLKLSTDNLEVLTEDAEQRLLKKLQQFNKDMLYSIENFEPQKIANYLEELAALFHKFYNECRIIGSEENVASARIALVTAVKQVLKNGLTLLGLSAPEKM